MTNLSGGFDGALKCAELFPYVARGYPKTNCGLMGKGETIVQECAEVVPPGMFRYHAAADNPYVDCDIRIWPSTALLTALMYKCTDG